MQLEKKYRSEIIKSSFIKLRIYLSILKNLRISAAINKTRIVERRHSEKIIKFLKYIKKLNGDCLISQIWLEKCKNGYLYSRRFHGKNLMSLNKKKYSRIVFLISTG